MIKQKIAGNTHKVFYFGALDNSGHYLYAPDGSKHYDVLKNNPWGTGLDQKYAPETHGQLEGYASFYKLDGWSMFSFWDRTIDPRPGSVSAYLAQGDYTFDEMVDLAKENFPKRWEAMAFKVKQL